MTRKLPPSASVAEQSENNRLIAPAASRNTGPLTELLLQIAPDKGHALELASGTGQHVLSFAQALPDLSWQPTEVEAERRASIDSYAQEQANIRPALALDACVPGWSKQHANQNLIVLINLLHLISLPEAKTLIREASRALAPGGRFVIYGPFMRGGELTSDGDARFHAALTEQDPEIGYKDDFDIMDLLQESGLDMAEVVEMPANNLALISQKPDF